MPFRGYTASPKETLGIGPTTPINIGNLADQLAEHPDQQFVQFLIQGLTYGFDTGFVETPQSPLICKNLQSALQDPLAVTELILKETDKGFLQGPFNNIPFASFRINPVGLATHKYSLKKRLIVDMSAPHDNPDHPSLNSLIDKESHSLQYVRIDDAIKIIKAKGRGSKLIKTDISDAFKLLPIRPDLWQYHGIQWNKQFYFFTRLVFGSRSSPKIFDNLSRAICWIAKYKHSIQDVLHLLDDFLVIVNPSDNADFIREQFLGIFHLLQVPIAPHKTEGPSTQLEYLGVTLDTDRMEIRLPSQKVDRILETIASFSSRKTCTKRELLSLLGHMNFASKAIRHGRSFVAQLIALSTTVKKLHHHVTLSAAIRSDLQMWATLLRHWNGASFFLDDNITLAADMHIYTDATPTSFGGIFLNKWFQGTFPPEFMHEQQSMALCELYPIVMACVMWGSQWSNKRILFHCDNLATVHIISKGRSKVKSINKLMRRLTYHSALFNFIIHAQHIPGKDNTIADALSRFQMVTFKALAPHADLLPTPCIPMEQLMMT